MEPAPMEPAPIEPDTDFINSFLKMLYKEKMFIFLY
jgi:hypothetical protein